MLELLVTATVLLCAVFLIRGALGRRIPAGARYGLWALVLVRLLAPVTVFPSRASVMNALPAPARQTVAAAEPAARTGSPLLPEPVQVPAQGQGTPVQAQVQAPDSAVVPVQAGADQAGSQAVPAQPEGGGPALDGAELDRTARNGTAVKLPWAALWAAGALAVGGWFLFVNLRFYGRLRRSRRAVDVPGCPVPVYRADFLPSPCLAGVFRPAVYLNAAALADQAGLRHVLTHELCHRRHGDNLWALLRSLCLCLWWFHPLVWVAAVLSKRDCELFCDAAAVKALGEGERIPYGRTLVNMVAQRRPGAEDLFCASTAMTEGKNQIRERVVRVTNHRKLPKAALAACLVLAMLAGLCTFTGAVAQSNGTSAPYRVEAQAGLMVSELTPNGVSIPDFDWKGSEHDYCREVALRYMAEYGKQFYALPESHPWKADDVVLLDSGFTLSGLGQPTGEGETHRAGQTPYVSGFVTLAVRPVGGADAVRPLFNGDVPMGTGEYRDHVLLEYICQLEPKEGMWVSEKGRGVSPQFHTTPMPYQVKADPALKAAGLDLGAVSLPDFDWNGLRTDYNREVGLRWAAEYGKQFYALPDGNPYKASDVQVVPPVFHPEGLMSLKGSDWYDGRGETVDLRADRDNSGIHGANGWLCLAIKPVGGIEAVEDLFHGGVPRGTGALSDHVLLEYHYDLDRVQAPGGGYVWKGAENGKLVTPAWNTTPPPAFNDWTDELVDTWRADLPVDVAAVVQGDDRAHWEEAGRKWADIFTVHHRYAYNNGNPAKADDVRVLAMDLETWEPNGKPDTLFFHLKYAFRPVWDRQLASLFMSRYGGNGTGANYGTGAWEDYLIVDATVTLVRDGEFEEEEVRWKGFQLQTDYASNFDNGMNLSTPFTVPQQDGAALQALEPVGVSVAYPAGTDETAIRDLVFGKWATAFAQQFYHLPAGDPLACSRVDVESFARFEPTVVTASGLTRVSDGVTGWLWLDLTARNGGQGAAKALEGKAGDIYIFEEDHDHQAGEISARWYVTLERGTGADGSVTWTCTAAYPDEPGYTGRGNNIPEGLPKRVEPRAGWSISALDYDAVYVPLDAPGDPEQRWIEAFGQEFYALPEGHPWKASDVQVRWAGDNLCLAVKPVGGTAALEGSFPYGCPKGSGDLEGYILLQYGVSLRQETVRQFGAEPVWVSTTGYAGPQWAVRPPEVGSEDWQDDMKYYWTDYQAGDYASAYGGNGGDQERAAAGTAWAWDYLSQYVEFGLGGGSAKPVLSDDVKLVSAQVSDYDAANQQMKLHLVYAFRPLWGAEAARAYFGGDVEEGSGALAGYLVRRETFTLGFRPQDDRGWPDRWVAVN